MQLHTGEKLIIQMLVLLHGFCLFLLWRGQEHRAKGLCMSIQIEWATRRSSLVRDGAHSSELTRVHVSLNGAQYLYIYLE